MLILSGYNEMEKIKVNNEVFENITSYCFSSLASNIGYDINNINNEIIDYCILKDKIILKAKKSNYIIKINIKEVKKRGVNNYELCKM